MDCSNYYFISPNYWICNGGSAFVQGLTQGAGEGVKQQLEHLVEHLYHKISSGGENLTGDKVATNFNNFISSFSEKVNFDSNTIGTSLGTNTLNILSSFKNSAGLNHESAALGKATGEKLIQFFENLKAGTGITGESLGGVDGANFGKNLNNFLNDFQQHSKISGQSIGDFFGGEINTGATTFFDNLDLSSLTSRVGEEFGDSFDSGISSMKLNERIKLLGEHVGEGLGEFRKIGFREADLIRNDIQQIFSNVVRDISIKAIPWLALGLGILIATPLSILYGYHQLKHRIGKPKLAGETRFVDLRNQAWDKVSRTIGAIWQCARPGLETGLVVGIGTTVGAMATAVGAVIMGYQPDDAPLLRPVLSILRGMDCQLENMFGHSSYAHNCEMGGMLNLEVVAGAIGTAVSVYYLAKLIGRKVKNFSKRDPVPVFNEQLSTIITEITGSTYNLKKNGGFFQNVLLYGPGGTGKTMIAKIIARESKMNYIMMSGGDLAQYIKRGEHVTELNKLFNVSAPTIIFIDEAESLCGDRGKFDRSELFELQNAFLNHTGEPSNKVMLILATNRAADLDEAVLNRMDHKLFIAPPAQPERKRILQQYIGRFFGKKEQHAFFSDDVLNRMAEQTEGFTGRTIFKMINALLGRKNSSANNKLTTEMVEANLTHFVEQEKQMNALREAAARKQSTEKVDSSSSTSSSPSEAPSAPVVEEVVKPMPEVTRKKTRAVGIKAIFAFANQLVRKVVRFNLAVVLLPFVAIEKVALMARRAFS